MTNRPWTGWATRCPHIMQNRCGGVVAVLACAGGGAGPRGVHAGYRLRYIAGLCPSLAWLAGRLRPGGPGRYGNAARLLLGPPGNLWQGGVPFPCRAAGTGPGAVPPGDARTGTCRGHTRRCTCAAPSASAGTVTTTRKRCATSWTICGQAARWSWTPACPTAMPATGSTGAGLPARTIARRLSPMPGGRVILRHSKPGHRGPPRCDRRWLACPWRAGTRWERRRLSPAHGHPDTGRRGHVPIPSVPGTS